MARTGFAIGGQIPRNDVVELVQNFLQEDCCRNV